MIPTFTGWTERLEGMTSSEAAATVEALGAHRHTPLPSRGERLLIAWHAEVAGLAYLTLNEAAIRRVTVQVRANYLLAGPGIDRLSPAGQRAAQALRETPEALIGEPLDAALLRRLSPADFRPLLLALDWQRTWADLIPPQRRLFDPQGTWTAEVQLRLPGQSVQLCLPFREAQALGYCVGVTPSQTFGHPGAWRPEGQWSRGALLHAAGIGGHAGAALHDRRNPEVH